MSDKTEGQKIMLQLITKFCTQYGIKLKEHDRIGLQLSRYFNFRLKFIGESQRQVRVSKELGSKLSTHPNRNGVFDIINIIAKGADVNPYQSKESFNADYHDLLFNDWGIHHLHLSSNKRKKTDYFNDRTNALLFARFTDSFAYLLDIKNHNDRNVWSDRDLIRIIQRNWPESLADYEMGAGVRFEPDLSDAEIGLLRKKGYLFGINVDDKSYLLLGHGSATSGDNIMASRLAGEVTRWIHNNEPLLSNSKDLFISELMKQLYIE